MVLKVVYFLKNKLGKGRWLPTVVPSPLAGEGGAKRRMRGGTWMLRQYQKKLRKNLTPHERIMWSCLRNRKLNQFKFRRQQVIGNYIVDFVCLPKKFIIELDGGQHIEDQKYDDTRTNYLNTQGFRVMRIWNVNLVGNIEKIMDRILCELEKR